VEAEASLRFEARGGFPDFDFTTVPDATAWQADHDIARLTPTADGLLGQISGPDPYLHGPASNYPAGTLLWLHLRLKSEQGGLGQVFYYLARRSLRPLFSRVSGA
jgi:hypothetical protein